MTTNNIDELQQHKTNKIDKECQDVINELAELHQQPVDEIALMNRIDDTLKEIRQWLVKSYIAQYDVDEPDIARHNTDVTLEELLAVTYGNATVTIE